MKISVVICTINPQAGMARCLGSIKRAGHPLEVLVVDQSSHEWDGYAEFYSKSLGLRVLRPAVHSLSTARNVAIMETVADVCVFIDDDAWIESNYFRVIEELFSSTAIDLVGGRILLPDGGLPYAHTQGVKEQVVSRSCWDLVLGGNLAVRRTLFSQIGVFDEHLGAGTQWGSAEESDLVLRALYRGHRVCYVPRLIAYHHTEAKGHSNRTLAAKLRRYGRGSGALHAKHFVNFVNLRILFSYFVSLLKPLVRIIQFTLVGDWGRIRVHAAIFIGRIEGFAEYMFRMPGIESTPLKPPMAKSDTPGYC